MNTKPKIPPLFLESLLKILSEDQITRLNQFLQPFCDTAITCLCRLFLLTVPKAGFDTVVTEAKHTYLDYWGTGTLGRIGDPDDVLTKHGKTLGLENTCAFFALYKKLGIEVKML